MLNVGTHARAHCTHNGKHQDAAETPSHARPRTQSSDRECYGHGMHMHACTVIHQPTNPATHKPVHLAHKNIRATSSLTATRISTSESAHYVVYSHHHSIASVNTRTAHDALSLTPYMHTHTPPIACVAMATHLECDILIIALCNLLHDACLTLSIARVIIVSSHVSPLVAQRLARVATRHGSCKRCRLQSHPPCSPCSTFDPKLLRSEIFYMLL
jgi:hypothetical protein